VPATTEQQIDSPRSAGRSPAVGDGEKTVHPTAADPDAGRWARGETETSALLRRGRVWCLLELEPVAERIVGVEPTDTGQLPVLSDRDEVAALAQG
jgi:hypothetical protein